MSSVTLSSAVLVGSVLVAAGALGAEITAVPSMLVESALFPAAFLGAVMGWVSVRPADAALSAIHVVTDTTEHESSAFKVMVTPYSRK
jgi:hypothetical protein